MSTQQVIELVLGAGGGAGAIKALITLTRLAVAVETAAEKIDAIVNDHDKTKARVDELQSRLDRGGL